MVTARWKALKVRYSVVDKCSRISGETLMEKTLISDSWSWHKCRQYSISFLNYAMTAAIESVASWPVV